jgi:RNA polymerase sigma-54 factor
MDRITTEMNDNPALETDASFDGADEPEYQDYSDHQDFGDADDFESSSEREERQSALDDALSNMGRDDDELPVYHGGNSVAEEREEIVYGESVSFYDQLKEQMGELDMTDTQRYVMEYLIGSLEDDGLLRKDLGAICDELAVYHNIDVTEQELLQVLHWLQTFDPAGIGARSLQ